MAKKTRKEQAPRPGPGKAAASPDRLRFDFIKSSSFRVIHVDGAWGGLRPDLNIHMNLYSERYSIPKSVTIEFDPENLPEEQTVEVESRNCVVREVEVCALLDLATAKSLRDWLDDSVQKAEERLSKMVSREEEEKGD